jgi:hypothetical protein
MKKITRLFYISFLLSSLTLVMSCEKEDANKDNIPSATVQVSDDNSEQREATDEAIDIAMNAFEGSSLRTSGYESDSCHYNVVTNEGTKSITITFSGDNCAGTRKREGSITAKVTSTAKSYQVGGTIEITYNNFKITRKSDGKSLTFNGKMIILNVAGLSNPLIHTIHGKLMIKFDNGQERAWVVARKRTITFTNQTITFKVESDSTGFIEAAGLDRNGKSFVTTIPTPIVLQNCTANDWKVIDGKIVYTLEGTTSLSAEFGFTSLTAKAGDCSAKGTVLTYTDSTTLATKYYPYQ